MAYGLVLIGGSILVGAWNSLNSNMSDYQSKMQQITQE